MEIYLNSEQSKLVDLIAINTYNYNSLQLMEIASYNIYINLIEIIKKYNIRKILILAGMGNNGGDGISLVKHLLSLENIVKITVLHIGKLDKISLDNKQNLAILNQLIQLQNGNHFNINIPLTKSLPKIEYIHIDENDNIYSKEKNQNQINKFEVFRDNTSIFDFDSINDNELIIEALVGVGIKSKLKGKTEEVINIINELNFSNNVIRLAVDNPAGIDVDTGKIILDNSTYFKTDYTFTLFSHKIGMLFNHHQNYYGEIKVCDIGFYPNIFIDFIKEQNTQFNFNFKLDFDAFRKVLPKRKNISSKFDYGRVCVFAGNREMTGAGIIASNTTLKIGAGLVYFITDESNNFEYLKPEVIKNEIDFEEIIDFDLNQKDIFIQELLQKYSKSDVWLIGPGLGSNSHLLNFIELLFYKIINQEKYIILDADGLLILNNLSLEQKYKFGFKLIITPHIFEFCRLIKSIYNPNKNFEMFDLNLNNEESINNYIIENYIDFSQKLANDFEIIVYTKYFPSLSTNGFTNYFNNNYNSGLSKAGSGDFLSGLISGILVQKLQNKKNENIPKSNKNTTLETVAIASILQTYLADKYTETKSNESLTPSDLIELLNFL